MTPSTEESWQILCCGLQFSQPSPLPALGLNRLFSLDGGKLSFDFALRLHCHRSNGQGKD
jgi:hypothetical protein